MRSPTSRLAISGFAALTALTLAAPASAAIAPDAAHSPNAEDMRLAYWVMLILGSLIILTLVAGLIGAVVKFRNRGRPDEPRRLEAGRGVIAKLAGGLSLVVALVFVFGVIVSDGVKDATAEEGIEELDIKAVSQQWLWRFEFPEQAEGSFSEGIATIFSYGELVVPVDTKVNLSIDSTDVIHSWFVPALGPQVWAVPGEITETSFIADEEGVYHGRSTVFSGSAYPTMRASVRVVSADEYEDYIAQLNADLQEGQQAVQGTDTAEQADDEESTEAAETAEGTEGEE